MGAPDPDPAAIAAHDALIEVDAHDRIVTWSRDAEELTGYRAGLVRGRGFCELLEARDLWGNRACSCGLREAVRHGEPLRSFLLDVRTATGKSLRVVVHALPAAGEHHSGAVLAFWVRRDLRRRQDRRRPAHPTEQESGRSPRGGPPPLPLSPREVEVLRLLATGTTTAAIAQRLGISVVTVRNHVQRLLDRLGAHSRLAAVARARERGWLD
jgi:PAS domain S-box-containing protein